MWYDRPESVFVEFIVEDSKDVLVKFDKCKFDFRWVVVLCDIPEPSFRKKKHLSDSSLVWLVFSDSCVSGSDKKLENSVDLFGEIDPKVPFFSLCISFQFKKNICLRDGSPNFLFHHAGIQLQTHSQICVVLFAKSRGRKTMATTYQRQS